MHATPAEPLKRPKFQNAATTADGAARAQVPFSRLDTLWVNTGTLCNIACKRCYIESSPSNDRLDYIAAAELRPFLEDAAALGAREIGFTGGEPFLNPDMAAMARESLERGFSVLILTNAMRPMMRPRVQRDLIALRDAAGARLQIRVSLDSHDASRHDEERGEGGFEETARGLDWLAANGFPLSVAGRKLWNEPENAAREAYARLFAARAWPVDAADPKALVLFPEMDAAADVPEITTACWGVLGKRPDSVMCASSRMVIKRKGADRPAVVACTLIPYAEAFELGGSLRSSFQPVFLNHPHCARFCVLGGASCSA